LVTSRINAAHNVFQSNQLNRLSKSFLSRFLINNIANAMASENIADIGDYSDPTRLILIQCVFHCFLAQHVLVISTIGRRFRNWLATWSKAIGQPEYENLGAGFGWY
jgi:hypothetical protein